MSVPKRNTTTKKSSPEKTVIVTKSRVSAKSASDNKLDKVNKMLSKTKWLTPE